MDSIDQDIVSAILREPSITDLELATRLGVSRQTVNKRRNSMPIKEAIQRHHCILRADIERVSKQALVVLSELLSHHDDRLRLGAATVVTKNILSNFTKSMSHSDEECLPEFTLET